MSKSKDKIKRIVVLAELTDGKVYNVLVKPETQQVIISTINLCENGIQLLSPPVDGIKVTKLNEYPNPSTPEGLDTNKNYLIIKKD